MVLKNSTMVKMIITLLVIIAILLLVLLIRKQSDNSSLPVSASTTQETADVEPDINLEDMWNLKLVNQDNPLSADYEIELREIDGYNDPRLFDVRAAGELERMLSDAEAQGVPMYVVSAYRTPERQETNFNNSVQNYIADGMSEEEAIAETEKYILRAYESEHNLGLAVDIVTSDWYVENTNLNEDFANTEHYSWLIANCADYGFILRYAADKVHITGVNYEPWHYRYVGIEAAKEIMAQGITLEEYLEQ